MLSGCCDGLLLVSILQGCLTLGVAYWLRRWALWTTTCPISGSDLSPTHCCPSCLSSIRLLTVDVKITPCPSPFSGVLSEFLPPLLCVSFQFLVYCSGFFFSFLYFYRGVSLPRGLCWFVPGVAGEYHVMLGTHLWSSECLPSRFGAGVWQWWQPTCFLSVTWHREAFHSLGVQGLEVLILLGALCLTSVALASEQGFWFTELTLSASVP
jgi:hypothetical protein